MLAFALGGMIASLSGAVLVQAFSWLPIVGQIPEMRSFVIVVLGGLGSLPGANVGWRRRGVTLALLPTSQFPESSFDIYYEVYNLPAGNQYETEISIQRVRESDEEEPSVRTLFSGTSSAGDDDSFGELRHVESALERGRYRLTVTVQDLASGQIAERSRFVDVRGWARGATLVPAMPYGARLPT